jgi:hypothetical protein
MRRLHFLILLLLTTNVYSQIPLSDSATISLVTVAPGTELYSIYGHSALRVRDRAQNLDRCFNYGTFDFDQPGFILKFMRGKLLYYVNPESGRAFERGNLADHRSMVEQELNLTIVQRQELYTLLRENVREENKFYKYDFFYDNCATRIRDIVKKAYGDKLTYSSNGSESKTTMRQLLDPFQRNYPWTDFGIDIILGMPADRIASPEDHMFLPEGMMKVFYQTQTPDGKPLVLSSKNIPDPPPGDVILPYNRFTKPMFISLLVFALGLFTMRYPKAERIFNGVFYFALGIAGLIIFFLWFLTDHQATKNNLNIFWALPSNLFYFWKNPRAANMRMFHRITGSLALLVLLLWPFGIQEFPLPALPLVVLIAIKGLWPYVSLKFKV